MIMTTQEFRLVSEWVHDRFGVTLDPTQRQFVESRLTPIVQSEGLHSFSELMRKARIARGTLLDERLVSALTVNETMFFRDASAFRALADKVLPALIDARRDRRRLRIWCGASSSGQEPVSLAILLLKTFPEVKTWDIRLTASDVSPYMVKRCRELQFSGPEVRRGLPPEDRDRFFRQTGDRYEACDEIRRMISPRILNLIEDRPPAPDLDLILMRNVLIYFDAAEKAGILRRATRALVDDGRIVLGSTESIMNIDVDLTRAPESGTGVFCKRSAVERPSTPASRR